MSIQKIGHEFSDECITEGIAVEKIHMYSQQALAESELIHQNADLEVLFDDFSHQLIARLKYHIHGIRDQDVRIPGLKLVIHEKWPDGWWQAVKDRWLPGWAKKRWPVKYKRIDVDEHRKPQTIQVFKAVCPHLVTDPSNKHVDFFLRHQFGNPNASVDL